MEQQQQQGSQDFKAIGAEIAQQGPQPVLQLLTGIAEALPDGVSLGDLAAEVEGGGQQQQAPPEAAMAAQALAMPPGAQESLPDRVTRR